MKYMEKDKFGNWQDVSRSATDTATPTALEFKVRHLERALDLMEKLYYNEVSYREMLDKEE